jgi:hypothetical protein
MALLELLRLIEMALFVYPQSESWILWIFPGDTTMSMHSLVIQKLSIALFPVFVFLE